DRDLQRLGCANQTTMLSSESLAIAEMFRGSIRARYGDTALDARFRSFDTICSATQDRQDAVAALLAQQPLDLMIVIGGYNSSNTCNLARICGPRVPTFHIAEAAGRVSIGLTSGASTPDNLVDTVIRRLEGLVNLGHSG